jgi:hypothetical protein
MQRPLGNGVRICYQRSCQAQDAANNSTDMFNHASNCNYISFSHRGKSYFKFKLIVYPFAMTSLSKVHSKIKKPPPVALGW